LACTFKKKGFLGLSCNSTQWLIFLKQFIKLDGLVFFATNALKKVFKEHMPSSFLAWVTKAILYLHFERGAGDAKF